MCAKGRDGNGTSVCTETATGMWVWAEAGAGVSHAGLGCDRVEMGSQQYVGSSVATLVCSSARPWPGLCPHACLLQTVNFGLAVLNISSMGSTQPSLAVGSWLLEGTEVW